MVPDVFSQHGWLMELRGAVLHSPQFKGRHHCLIGHHSVGMMPLPGREASCGVKDQGPVESGTESTWIVVLLPRAPASAPGVAPRLKSDRRGLGACTSALSSRSSSTLLSLVPREMVQLSNTEVKMCYVEGSSLSGD